MALPFPCFQRFPELACLAETLATQCAYVVGWCGWEGMRKREEEEAGGRREGERTLADLPWVPGQSRSKVKSGRRLPSGIFSGARAGGWAGLGCACVWGGRRKGLDKQGREGRRQKARRCYFDRR